MCNSDDSVKDPDYNPEKVNNYRPAASHGLILSEEENFNVSGK